MKIKLTRFILAFMILFIMSSQLYSQEKPIRIGVKAGFPNLVTGNIEFVTPLLNQRLAVMVDYSKLSLNHEEINLNYSYVEAGLNYYLRRPGHGPYFSVSYTDMSIDLTYTDVESNDDPDKIGSATAAIGMNTFNVKLGAKWGGLIYFRPEIGFLFTALPPQIDVEVHFPDGSFEAQVEDVPSILRGAFIFNIGFGFSF